MSNRLAVDIVVLPPERVMDEAVTLSQRLNPKEGPVLNKQDCLPHITLMQAVVTKDQLPGVRRNLKTIASQSKPIKLQTILVYGGRYASLEVLNLTQVTELHRTIMQKLTDLVSFDAVPEHFYDSTVNQATVDWVRNFPANAAGDNYWPHITIAKAKIGKLKKELSFTADRLAICHLGNYNTCRKVLFETTLV